MRIASPERMVVRLPAQRSQTNNSVPWPFVVPRAVLRLPPADDGFDTAMTAASHGDALIICASVFKARSLATRMRSAGMQVALHPDEWARAAAGGVSVIGARSVAFAPMPSRGGVVILDEHDEALQAEGSPTWHAREVGLERARRAKVPAVMTSPMPTLEAVARSPLVTVDRVTERAGWASLHVIDRPEPNAFATGRSPSHAAVAVTTGILDVMDDRQLRGVLAHEISHITNRDMLVGTIAATIGGAISFLGNMALWSSMFGGGNDEDSIPLPLMLLTAILAPIAATIIQLAVSRSREYGADQSGAALTGDPEGLAIALETLDGVNERLRAERGGLFGRGRGRGQRQPVPAATAHLYTVSPLAGGAGSLFSTHPPIAERVRRLRSMRSR